MDEIDNVISDRKQRYGDFKKTSSKLIALQDVLWDGVDYMPAYVKRAANMILEKLVRAVTGDPFYKDNWIDIQGYARLAITTVPCVTTVPHIKATVFTPPPNEEVENG